MSERVCRHPQQMGRSPRKVGSTTSSQSKGARHTGHWEGMRVGLIGDLRVKLDAQHAGCLFDPREHRHPTLLFPLDDGLVGVVVEAVVDRLAHQVAELVWRQGVDLELHILGQADLAKLWPVLGWKRERRGSRSFSSGTGLYRPCRANSST